MFDLIYAHLSWSTDYPSRTHEQEMEEADSMHGEELHQFPVERDVEGGQSQIVFVPRLSFHQRCGKGVTISKMELVRKAS